jgi:polysaccharide export outer membrane protein
MTSRFDLFALVCVAALGALPRPADAQADRTRGAAAVSSVTATATDPPLPEYQIGAGDKLRVEVYRDPQLSQSVQVRPDGKITLPLVGDVAVVGLTPIQLRDRLATALREYVTNPVVTVIVVEAAASNVYVMGEVNRPGTLPMQGPMTVLQALAMAGGFKDFANTKDIRVLRRGPTGVETIRFNYKEALKGRGAPVYLKSGDTIIVP